jgi:hypothetical protein
VAQVTVDQALAVGVLYENALADVFVFARNTEMQREIYNDLEPDGIGFPNTPLGTKIDSCRKTLTAIQEALVSVQRAASYDPKHPPVAGDG